MKRSNLLLCCLLAAGCHETAPDPIAKNEAGANAASRTTPATKKIPLFRASVSKEPVAEFKERTPNPLNDWYFSVKLYETSKTFQYRMKLQYEEVAGEDILTLPDLGKQPKPVIQNGPDKYSCIVGFMDASNKFREYKKVYINNKELKVTTLKHYTLAVYNK